MTKETDIQNRELEELFERYRQAPDSYVFVMLADSCRKLGRFEEALAICEEGMEKHPDYASGQVVSGKCLYDLDRHDDARAAFQEVLRIDHNNLVALKFLGMIDAESGDLESARAHFQRILVLDPDNKEIMHALRVVDEKGRAQEDVQDLDAADAVHEAAAPLEADLETSDELASATLADIFASQGYKDKALAIYRELHAQQPSNMAVRARIAALTGEPLELPDEDAVGAVAEVSGFGDADEDAVGAVAEVSGFGDADEDPVGAVAEVSGFGDADEDPVGAVAEVSGFGDADEDPVGAVAEVSGFGDADEDSTADVDGDDEMVGETIELTDGGSVGSDDTPLAIELPGPPASEPEWTGDSRAAASTTSDGDLDADVDSVITMGVDTKRRFGQAHQGVGDRRSGFAGRWRGHRDEGPRRCGAALRARWSERRR